MAGESLASKSTPSFVMTGVGGFVARRHLAAIKSIGGVLLGALDPNDSVGILDSYFPHCKFFTEFERFWRWLARMKAAGDPNRPKWMSICAPNWLHDSHIRLAMDLGMNVIVEKPAVVEPWNLESLICETIGHGKIFVVHQLRHHPDVIALKEKVAAAIARGEGPFKVDLTYITPRGPWYKQSWKGDESRSGGIIMNLGIHFLDLLLWIFGRRTSMPVIQERSDSRIVGRVGLTHAKVNFMLSTRWEDAVEGKPKRFLRVDDIDAIRMDGGFEDLHKDVYWDALHLGKGTTLKDVEPSIELAHEIRTEPLSKE